MINLEYVGYTAAILFAFFIWRFSVVEKMEIEARDMLDEYITLDPPEWMCELTIDQEEVALEEVIESYSVMKQVFNLTARTVDDFYPNLMDRMDTCLLYHAPIDNRTRNRYNRM